MDRKAYKRRMEKIAQMKTVLIELTHEELSEYLSTYCTTDHDYDIINDVLEDLVREGRFEEYKDVSDKLNIVAGIKQLVDATSEELLGLIPYNELTKEEKMAYLGT